MFALIFHHSVGCSCGKGLTSSPKMPKDATRCVMTLPLNAHLRVAEAKRIQDKKLPLTTA